MWWERGRGKAKDKQTPHWGQSPTRGFNPTTLRPGPELKSRVSCLTDGAPQVPQKQILIYKLMLILVSFYPLTILFGYQLKYLRGDNNNSNKNPQARDLEQLHKGQQSCLCMGKPVVMWGDCFQKLSEACLFPKWFEPFVLSLHWSQCVCVCVSVFLHVAFSLTKIHYDRQPLGLKLIWNSPRRQLLSVWEESTMTCDRNKSSHRNCGYFLSGDALGVTKLDGRSLQRKTSRSKQLFKKERAI